MKTIFTIALLMTSTILFGAKLNIEFNPSNKDNSITYMDTLAFESEKPSIMLEERISSEVVTVEDSESVSKNKEEKKTTDKKESSKPNQDYEILKRSQRILEVKYKLYA